MSKELKITEDRVKQVMEKCPVARDILEELFGDQLNNENKDIIKDFTYNPCKYVKLQGNAHVSIDHRLLGAFKSCGHPIKRNLYPGTCLTMLQELFKDMNEKANKILE